jgi:hypothetical protein
MDEVAFSDDEKALIHSLLAEINEENSTTRHTKCIGNLENL